MRQAIAQILEAIVMLEKPFCFLRYIGKPGQQHIAQIGVCVAALDLPAHGLHALLIMLIERRMDALQQEGLKGFAAVCGRGDEIRRPAALPLQQPVQQGQLKRKGERFKMQHKLRIVSRLRQILHQQIVFARPAVLRPAPGFVSIQPERQILYLARQVHSLPRLQSAAGGQVSGKLPKVFRDGIAELGNRHKVAFIQQRRDLPAQILPSDRIHGRLCASVFSPRLLVLVELQFKVNIVTLLVGALAAAGALFKVAYLDASRPESYVHRHLREDHLHLRRAGGQIDQNLCIRVLAADERHCLIQRAIQLVDIVRVSDAAVDIADLRPVPAPVRRDPAPGLFKAAVLSRHLPDLRRQEKIGALRPIVPENVQHRSVMFSTYGICRTQTAEQNLFHRIVPFCYSQRSLRCAERRHRTAAKDMCFL